MPRVLVVDDETHVREVLRRALLQWGYEVVEAENGKDALEKFNHHLPDVILLDVAMPVMGGFEALRKFREAPSSAETPIILVTTFPASEGEPIAMTLGSQHYISKPFDFDVLKSTIKVALRESQAVASQTPGEDAESLPETSPQALNIADTQVPHNDKVSPDGSISTGIELVDEELGGGISRGSLALIEGTVAVGKSLLCQHLAYQSLLNREGVFYITSEETEESFNDRLSSIGMRVSEHIRRGLLQVHCLEEPILGEHWERSLVLLAQQLKRVPRQYQTIIVDSITHQAVYVPERPLVGFFQSCKGQCQGGQTICLVTHSAIFEEKLWLRLRSLLDTHIRLSPKPMGRKLVKTLEVLKINNMDVHTGRRIAFEVQSGKGMLPTRISEFTV